jgi:hypothetical protein
MKIHGVDRETAEGWIRSPNRGGSACDVALALTPPGLGREPSSRSGTCGRRSSRL